MEIETSKDIGEEIMIKLEELEEKLNRLIKMKNEKEFSNTYQIRN